MTLFFISFVSGLLTVLAPCVLPLLPVIIGGSVSGSPSPKRALIITASLGVSVFVFTFLLKVSAAFIDIPPSFWTLFSGGIVFVVGVFMFLPVLWEHIVPASINIKSNALLAKGHKKQSLWGDVIVGGALGPVFSSCSPTYFVLLAVALPANYFLGTLYLLAYVAGLSVALFGIAFAGQRLIDRLGVASDSRGWFKRGVGILFMLVGLAIIFGIDKKIEASLPAGFYGITNLEQKILKSTGAIESESAKSENTDTTTSISDVPVQNSSSNPVKDSSSDAERGDYLTAQQKSGLYSKAPELVAPEVYLNTNGQVITLEQYKGKKVVLIDFWTYSCINCQRTLPYLTSWYEKYKDNGLVIIGVHTPEFAFERVEANVQKALDRFGIKYPVVLDNQYKTWSAYENNYWPRKYLVDIDGYVVYDHIGEGEYEETEKGIQKALGELAYRLGDNDQSSSGFVSVEATKATGVRSPETYFGARRNEYLGNGASRTEGEQELFIPKILKINTLYLGGGWDITGEYAKNTTIDASVKYYYSAGNVYLVASGVAEGTEIEVLQDGEPIGTAGGADVVNGVVTITESRLYHLVQNQTPGAHILEFIIKTPGLQAYAFTFG